MAEREFVVALEISAEAFERLYRGRTQTVIAEDVQGRRIRFPAVALRGFVTHEGISGVFRIRVDADNRLIDISRVPQPSRGGFD